MHLEKFLIYQVIPLSLLFFSTFCCASFSNNCTQTPRTIGLILDKAVEPGSGCKIKQIIPLSRAWYSDLTAGDQITAVNHIKLGQSIACPELIKQLKQAALQQKAIILAITSNASSLSSSRSVSIPAQTPELLQHQQFINTDFFDQKASGILQHLQVQLQKQHLDQQSILPLYQSLACLPSASPKPVLPIVAHVHNNPLALAADIDFVIQQLLPSGETKAEFSLAHFSDRLLSLSYQSLPARVRVPVPKPKPTDLSSCSITALLDDLEKFITDSHHLSHSAFTAVNAQQHDFFIKHYKQLADTIIQVKSIMNEPDAAAVKIISQLFEIAGKVNYAKLSAAASHWFRLADQDRLQQLTTCLSENPPEKIMVRDTPYGRIILGTAKSDIYSIHPEQKDIALIIDPGGDDVYIHSIDRLALPNSLQHALQKKDLFNTAIIDLSGNDQYDASDHQGFAFAALGISLLIDLSGNDNYKAGQWAQGSAFAGIAALYDVSGNDRYTADSFSQAIAVFGAGILVDRQGHDNYTIRHHGQALGLPYGHGILLDQDGDDHYKMEPGLPSSYQQAHSTLQTSESWGQGSGKGFRHILPGGLGILIDSQGNNNFSAFEFAQGGAYYYGMGLLYSLGDGDDDYNGSRYNAGYSAHQAIGGFIEEGGNDHYQTQGPAFCGTAWDQSISLFHDQSGDDVYTTRDFSLAATAHNSIASFWDISGQDNFTEAIKPAFVSSNDYHGGHSLSYFFSASSWFANKKISARIDPEKQAFVLTGPAYWPQLNPLYPPLKKGEAKDTEADYLK